METNNILNAFDALGKHVYAGSAKRKTVEKRRAKNKAARKQRKINKK